jgi:hypothetical protein
MNDFAQKKTSTFLRAHLECFVIIVELPGFEPGSKQGDHTLSTCLAPT